MKGDFTYARGAWNKTDDPAERRDIERRFPVLRRRAAVEAALKRVAALEKQRRRNEERGVSAPGLDERIKEEKRRAVDVMLGL